MVLTIFTADGGGDTLVAGTAGTNADTNDNSLHGGPGNDTLTGGDNASFGDYLHGGWGNDTLYGLAGNDYLYDIIDSSDPYDTTGADINLLDGGSGNDTFRVSWKNYGMSTLTGGTGSDRYDLDPHNESEISITDFTMGAGGDILNIIELLSRSTGYSSGNPFDPALGYLRLIQSDANAILQWDKDGAAVATNTWKEVLTLKNINLASTPLTQKNLSYNLPKLTGTPATLSSGLEDTNYTVPAVNLLQGWTDADGDTLSIQNLAANHGTVVNNGDGTYTILPETNYNGTVTLSYRVSDGVNTTAASIGYTLTAVNDAPTATNLSIAETYTEDTAKNLTDIVISDIDSATVTATLTLSNPAAGSMTTATSGAVTSTYNAGTGVWTASGAVVDINTLLAGVTFNPALNFNSSFTIGTSVSDGVAAAITGSKTMTGTAVNDTPSFTKGTNQTVNEDAGAQSVTGWATNLSKGPSDESSQTLTFLTSNDNNALFAVQPAIDASGNLTYTPAANANGSATVTVSLKDNGGTANGGIDASAEQTFTITVDAANDAPQLTGTAATLSDGQEDTDYPVTAATLLTGWTDSDGDSLSIIQIPTVDHGTVSLNNDNSFTIHPEENYNGLVTINYQVSDSTVSADTSLSFNLDPVNDAPELTGTAATLPDGTENTNYTIQASALLVGWTDVEGDSLSIANLTADHGQIIDNGDGTYTLQPDADYSGTVVLNYDVSDGAANTPATLEFTLNINTNQDPILDSALTDQAVKFDNSLNYAAGASFSDPDGDTLSFSATLGNGDPLPGWMQIDTATGVIFGTPGFDNRGTYALSVTATDTGTASISTPMTIAVTVFNAGQLLVSTAGDDTLTGSAGMDTVTYAYAPSSVTVLLANLAAQVTGYGTDTLGGIENLIGSASNDTLTGDGLANVLDGGAGADQLNGGAGNDTYVLDDAGDAITEINGGGTDLVLTWITLPLLANNVENMTLLGSDSINATGNAAINTLTGNSGDNVLDGQAGKDKLLGGAGNDTYIVDSTGDTITENTNEGSDTVQSTVSFTLGNNIENLTLLQNLAINGTGNGLDNILTGSGGNNTLNGMAGNDTIIGGNGTDILIGGLGKDQMTGGNGADTFRFTTLTDSGIGASRDAILDFSKVELDKIDISGIDAKSATSKNDAFALTLNNGTAAFTAAGQLRYFYDNVNNVTIVEGNVDATLTADFQIQLTGNIVLASTDFVL